MNVNFRLDNKDHGGLRYIFADVTHASTRSKFSLKIKVRPDDWSNKRQEIKQGRANAKLINQFLQKTSDEIEAAYIHLSLEDNIITAKAIRAKWELSREEKQKDFWDRFGEFWEVYVQTLRPGTVKRWKNCRNHLLRFEEIRGRKISYTQIDSNFADQFRAFLLDRGNNHNSATHLIKKIIAFCRYSEKSGWYQFGYKIKGWNVKTTRSDDNLIALNEEELIKIRDFPFEKERLQRVRDLFVFQASVGCRYSDLEGIQADWLVDGVLYFRNIKSDRSHDVKLSQVALLIWEKYQGEIPVISNQKYNAYIKEAAKVAGLIDPVFVKGEMVPKYKLISTHTARRTFATILDAKGVSISLISKVIGHANVNTTQDYLKHSQVKRHKAINDNIE